MNNQEYIKNRVDNQIDWYDKKSTKNKKAYLSIKVCSIIFSAAIPVLTGLSVYSKYYLIFVSIFGSLTLILTSLSSIFRWHDNWIRYRSISEQLKHEKYAYLTNSGVYESNSLTFNSFVDRCESFISSENINWTNLNTNKKEK